MGSRAASGSYLFAYLILRVALTWLTGSWGLGDRRLAKILWLVPVRDAISFIVWLAGFFAEKIVWRGLTYRLHAWPTHPHSLLERSPSSAPRIRFLRRRITRCDLRWSIMAQSKHPQREPARPGPPLVNCVDRLGRPIEPVVLSVAQESAPQAVSYVQKYLADPCIAINLLEEAAATVSQAVLAKRASNLPPIRDMRAYLYRAFLRRVSAYRQTELQMEDAFEEQFRLIEGKSFDEIAEARLLLKQILRMCDRKTRWIVWERIEGRSWDEIAYDMAMSNRAARLHYSRSVRKIREAFETNGRLGIDKVLQAERKRQRKARLTNLFQALWSLRLFRLLRVKSVFGVRFRITHHDEQEMLADVENMFS